MSPPTLFWHDYETWGADPRRDRAVQFAGQRTGLDLAPLGEAIVLYARPPLDQLPHPEACLVTGIRPQLALERGLIEADFFAAIAAELSRPGTCGVGYNTLRFDDEVTRFGLYRNFFDPYAREWRDGNSRWDLIDTVRLAHALRPDGIVWPKREDGSTSFRLEELTAANGLGHAAAHDALSDVNATIALARLLRARQPRLYDYAFGLRDKRKVAELLDWRTLAPVLHVSSKYPASLGCIALVAPLARHPSNPNGVLVFDLRVDPAPFLELPADALHRLLFTSRDALEADEERLPVKTVHLNRCPVLAPPATLDDAAAARWRIDRARCTAHRDRLAAHPQFTARLAEVLTLGDGAFDDDPDVALYAGFIGDRDRRMAERVRAASPRALASGGFHFEDPRLNELLYRYRARNWPGSLTTDERARWEEFRRERLVAGGGAALVTATDYRERIATLRAERANDPAATALLDALEAWGKRLLGPIEEG